MRDVAEWVVALYNTFVLKHGSTYSTLVPKPVCQKKIIIRSELFFASKIIASGDTLLNHTCSGGCGLEGGGHSSRVSKGQYITKKKWCAWGSPPPPLHGQVCLLRNCHRGKSEMGGGVTGDGRRRGDLLRAVGRSMIMLGSPLPPSRRSLGNRMRHQDSGRRTWLMGLPALLLLLLLRR